MSKILIGVTGGIAAYKAASVVSVLVDKGHDVKVIMTENAKEFVGPVTFSALSHNPVYDDSYEFSDDGHIYHIELAEWADVFAIVPGTYNTINKIMQGLADNLLTSTVVPFLSMPKPFQVYPAMNTNMWYTLTGRINPFDGNLEAPLWLKRIGTGKLACGTEGPGKLIPTGEIVAEIEKVCPKQGGTV